jgi:hypothetical protein
MGLLSWRGSIYPPLSVISQDGCGALPVVHGENWGVPHIITANRLSAPVVTLICCKSVLKAGKIYEFVNLDHS